MEDYYQLLGISEDSSSEEIKKRFHYLALVYHPDRFPNPKLKTQAEEDFKKISTAYQVLSNPRKRAVYDRARSSDLLQPKVKYSSTKPVGKYRQSHSNKNSGQSNKETKKH